MPRPTVQSPVQSPTSLALQFHALADPLRMQVIELLRNQELCVCDLCDRLGVKQPKLSFHLRVLKEAQLIQARQEGRWVYYCLNIGQLFWLEQYLSSFRRLTPIQPARPCCDD